MWLAAPWAVGLARQRPSPNRRKALIWEARPLLLRALALAVPGHVPATLTSDVHFLCTRAVWAVARGRCGQCCAAPGSRGLQRARQAAGRALALRGGSGSWSGPVLSPSFPSRGALSSFVPHCRRSGHGWSSEARGLELVGSPRVARLRVTFSRPPRPSPRGCLTAGWGIRCWRGLSPWLLRLALGGPSEAGRDQGSALPGWGAWCWGLLGQGGLSAGALWGLFTGPVAGTSVLVLSCAS